MLRLFDPARDDVCSSDSVAVCGPFKCFRADDAFVRVLSLLRSGQRSSVRFLYAGWRRGMSAMRHRSFPAQPLPVSRVRHPA